MKNTREERTEYESLFLLIEYADFATPSLQSPFLRNSLKDHGLLEHVDSSTIIDLS